VRDDSGGPQFTDWYPGGEINVAHNVVDRHAAVDSPNRNRVAPLIWEGEPGDIREVTFHELARQTNRVANYLESVGIETGDTVGLYMPMVPEVVSILYGCLKVGAIAVPIFSGFGTEATATRIADAEPSVLFTGDGFYRRGSEVRLKATADEAIEAAGHVDDVVVYDRLGATPEGDAADPVPWNPDRDVTWTEAIESRSVDYETKAAPERSGVHAVVLLRDHRRAEGDRPHPRGRPHAVRQGDPLRLRPEAGRPVLLGLRHRLDDGAVDADREPRVRRDGGDVRGCTRPPGAGPLLGDDRPTRNYAVRHLADRDPGAPQARRRMGRGPRSLLTPNLGLDRRAVGSRIVALVLRRRVGGGDCPIINISGGTEICGCFLMPMPNQPLKPCTLGGPGLGMDIDIVDESGESIKESGERGYLVARDSCPSMTKSLWSATTSAI